MYTLELGVFMYKIHVNELPMAFSNFFKKRADVHNYPTRQVNYLSLSLYKKSFSDHAIRTNEPHLWNSLSQKLKDETS